MNEDRLVIWCDLCQCCVPYNEELKGWFCPWCGICFGKIFNEE